jgi:hypothetical protein
MKKPPNKAPMPTGLRRPFCLAELGLSHGPSLRLSKDVFRLPLLLLVATSVLIAGCHSPAKIERMRLAFLSKPVAPHQYDSPSDPPPGIEPYLYLVRHDPAFGEFLFSTATTTTNARIIVAALTYFGDSKADPNRYDEIVRRLDEALLSQDVSWGHSCVIYITNLKDWIESRKRANQTPKPISQPRSGSS